MVQSTLPGTVIDQLSQVSTPTVANAIEAMGADPPDQGYTDPAIRCLFPEFKPIVGYACTLVIRSDRPAIESRFTSRKGYWDHIARYPAPRIVICHDQAPSPRGAYFGEVNCNIHKALGCVGLITDGAVRDLEEVRALGFQAYAASVSVSHAYAHLEDFDVPVSLGSWSVQPGDLIHADQHGALVIPADCLGGLPDAIQRVLDYEKPMIELAQSDQFNTERLAELLKNETV